MADSFRILHRQDLEQLTGCKTPTTIERALQFWGIAYKHGGPIIWTTSTALDNCLGSNPDDGDLSSDEIERRLVHLKRAKQA